MADQATEPRRTRWGCILGGLVVVFVVVGLMITAVARVREAAARSQSVNNLRQIGTGIHNWRSAYEDRIPTVADEWRGARGSLFYLLLSCLESGDHGPELQPRRLIIYVAPGDPSAWNDLPLTSYASNVAVFGRGKAIGPGRSRMADVLGARAEADVACFVERYGVAGGREHRWADPADGATWLDGNGLTFEVGVAPEGASDTTAHAWHAVGLHVGLADGSVRLVEATIAPAAFARLFDPKAGPE